MQESNAWPLMTTKMSILVVLYTNTLRASQWHLQYWYNLMVGWIAIIKSLNQIIYITLYNILSNFVIPTIYGQWHPRVRWIANIPNNFHQAPHQLGADTTPAQQITFAPKTVSHPRPFEKVTGWLNGCSMVFKGSEWDLRWFKGGLLDLLKFWRKLGNLEDVPWFFLWFWVIF